MRPRLLAASIVAALTLTLTLAAAAAQAWGPNGHRIVGAVAAAHLSPEASAAADGVLRGLSLAQVATWPDEIRADPTWSCAAPFHFTTIRPGAAYPDAAVENGDAVQALVYYTDRLRAAEASATERRIALSFIVHLVGDLHQPLHNGLGCDRGGNQVGVAWFGEPMNLHSVWDEGIIGQEALGYSEFAAFLVEAERARPTPAASPSPLDWIEAGRSHLPGAYSCDLADGCVCYSGTCADGLSPFGGCGTLTEALAPETVGAVPQLKYRYQFRALPVVRAQLTRGGRNLAAHLDWALDPGAAAPPAWRALAEQVRVMDGWDAAARACRGLTTP